jgi:bifunctional oligoribonuclease and PAP phosphatase NrnA
MRYQAPDWDRVVESLEAAQDVIVACHTNPDGDALGSVLGLSLGLRRLGKKAHASWGEKLVVPPSYAFLPGTDALMDPNDLHPTEVIVALDCGAADRLGTLEGLAFGSPCLINIDHHTGNDRFGTLNIVVTDASSTAELVTHLLADLGLELDRDIATCLYTGLVTDTGRFQFTNATPDTLRLAADLMAYGVDAADIAQQVFESSPFGYLKLVGRVLERTGLFPQERFVYSWITQQDLIETGVGMDETERLVDEIRATREADVAAMFKEQEDGTYRVSLRSKGPASVGAIARQRGGGGHELAAGFTAPSVESAVHDIRRALAA